MCIPKKPYHKIIENSLKEFENNNNLLSLVCRETIARRIANNLYDNGYNILCKVCICKSKKK